MLHQFRDALFVDAGHHVQEQIAQVIADKRAQMRVGDACYARIVQRVPDGAAYVSGAVQQSAVNVEQIQFEGRQRHAGAGLSPSMNPWPSRGCSWPGDVTL